MSDAVYRIMTEPTTIPEPFKPRGTLEGETPLPSPSHQVLHSSAAFLHHLHTDPSSHHITLSGGVSRHESDSAPSRSPQSISVPLEPTVEGGLRAFTTTSPRRGRNVKSASHPVAATEPMAGPSRLKRLGSGSPRKGRPMTAPVRGMEDALASHEVSPEMDRHTILEDQPRPASPDSDLEQLSSAVDNFATSFAGEDEEGFESAMEALAIAGPHSPGHRHTAVLGRAGNSAAPGPALANPGPLRSPETDFQTSWKTFAKSYAHGLFDPNRIPKAPRSSDSLREGTHSAHSSPGKAYTTFLPQAHSVGTTSSSESQGSFSSKGKSSGSSTTMTSTSSPPVSSASAILISAPSQGSKGSMALALAARRKTFELGNLRKSPKATSPPISSIRPDQLQLTSYSLAAATVRMASSTLTESDFAPLGRPSPDRELTDPLSSYTSPNSFSNSRESASSDPGSSTRFLLSTSMSSAITTSALEAFHLPTIQASPVSTPLEHPGSKGKSRAPGQEMERRSTSPPPRSRGSIVNTRIPPATAPLEKTLEAETTTDYFGSAAPHFDRQTSFTSQSSSSHTVTGSQNTPIPANRARTPDVPSHHPPVEDVELPPAIAQPSEMGPLYEKLGWLPAPLPPGEAARRKALYRFNVLYTAPDIHFDRIAHMAKLVFSTKIVLIALIDGPTQWYKSESGLGSPESDRISSMCSHAILTK